MVEGARRATGTIPSPWRSSFGWDALLKLEAVVSANLHRATRLRQSILQKAFTGKLLTADCADDADKRRNPSVKSA
jgi:bifunctional DNA-binding transcriptional regulator/antitoxin component of YhaV-PrlF toxin-antitoxin module